MSIKPKGFIAILVVLALLAVSLSLLFAVPYLSIGESQSGLIVMQGAAALQAAEGCAQDALLLSIRDENYTGGSYEYLDAACTVATAKDGTIWTLSVSSTKDGFTRSLEIIFDRVLGTPATITLQSFLEE